MAKEKRILGLTETQWKTKDVHDALGCHEWMYIDKVALNIFEPCIFNRRRICLGCRRIEYDYGWMNFIPPMTVDWRLDSSGLARSHIEGILEHFPEYVYTFDGVLE